MFGLAYLVFFVVYLLVSVAAVRGAIGYARKNGKSAKRWGWGAAFVMYSIVFWDFIPTVAVHQYYCAKDSGFWVYKTLDQWKAENPGVAEGLVAYKGAPSRYELFDNGHRKMNTFLLNDRFNWIVSKQDIWLTVRRHEDTLVDSKTNEVLARYVDFGSYNREWGGLRFWTSIQYCSDGESNYGHFLLFKRTFQGAEK